MNKGTKIALIVGAVVTLGVVGVVVYQKQKKKSQAKKQGVDMKKGKIININRLKTIVPKK